MKWQAAKKQVDTANPFKQRRPGINAEGFPAGQTAYGETQSISMALRRLRKPSDNGSLTGK